MGAKFSTNLTTPACMLQDPQVQLYSPPVHLHVLSVEEEDSGRNESDVKVLGVDGDRVHVHYEHLCHL